MRVDEPMTRTLELRVRIPPILLRGWIPGEEDSIGVAFRKDGLSGEMSLRFDPESVEPEEWYEDGVVGEASCDRMIVRIEGQCEGDISEEAWLHICQELTDQYMNRLLLYIKSELQQYWVTTVPISEWNLRLFIARTSARWIDEAGHTELEPRHAAVIIDLPVMEFYDRRLTLDIGAWEHIGSWIQAEEADHALLAKTALANAKRSFEQHNYGMAAVDTVTALDLAVPRFVEERCRRQSISLPRRPSIGWALPLLPLVMPTQELESWISQQDAWLRRPIRNSLEGLDSTGQLITAQCIELNRLRNKIVHEAYDPRGDADIECIKQGVLAAEWLLGFIAQDLQ